MRIRFRPGLTFAYAMLAAVLLFQAIGTYPAQAQAQVLAGSSSRERVFIGPIADHFVDPTGKARIETVAAHPSLFTVAKGRTANRGVSPTGNAAFWLRVRMPDLPPGTGWVISLHEARISHAALYVPTGTEWRIFDWKPKDDYTAGRQLLRYPAFHVEAGSISGQEIYVRVETHSSMRALLWLESDRAYAATYGQQALAFGGLMGALVALFAYLLAIGWALRDGALLRLSALVLAFMIYVAADRAFVETALIPGAFDLSRMASLSGSLLTFAAWLSFEACYLKVPTYRPWLERVNRAGIVILLICAAQVVVEFVADIRIIRLYSSYIGLVALAAGVGLALAMMFHEWRRALLFLLCWLPAIAGGAARLLLDAADGLAPNAFTVNAVYWGAGLSLLIFGIVTSLDIQARERGLLRASQSSEARFRSFADSASDSFWETDENGRLAYLAGRIDGRALGFILRSGFIESLRRTSRSSGVQNLATLERALRERTAFRSVVLALQEQAGLDRYLAVSGTPITDTDGRYCGHRGIFSDVTNEILLSERQMQQQKMAALGQLAGGVAHEINNLLHPIINLTRRVLSSLDPMDERRYQMGIVEDAGLRAREIVAGILTTVRPGLQASPLVPFDQALAKAIDAVRPAIPAAVELDVRIDRVDTFSVPLGELLQVVGNLVGNAVHAMAGAGRIEVSLRQHADRNEAVLCIADNGAGMDAETRRQAFEPFFTTRSTSGGTGLGLALVYRIVTGWGASIDIQSEVNQGTKIVITFLDDMRITREGAIGYAEFMSDPGDR